MKKSKFLIKRTMICVFTLLVGTMSCKKNVSEVKEESDISASRKGTLASTYAVVSTLLWSDEFNGSALDLNKWSYELGNGCPDLCGWGNNEKEYYTSNSANINVADGYLNITAKYQPNYLGGSSSFTSGKITSSAKFNSLYGRFEARIKLPAGLGLWPAFWMLPQDKVYGGWPTSGEIDIMEYRGDITNKIGGTLHYGNGWPNNQNDGTSYILSSGNFSNSFHDFAAEWEPGIIRFYVDGILYKTETKSPNSLSPQSNNAVKWPWDQNFYMLLNLAVGGWYPGNPSTADIINGDTNYSRTMQVDYVRVYGLIPTGNTIYLLGSNNKYVSGESGITTMNCNKTSVTTAESFTIIDAGSGKVALKSNNKYVSSENGVSAMICNRTNISNWEKFDYIVNSDGTISLRGNNGKYVSTEGGTSPMTCSRTNVANWEKFRIGN